MTIPHSNKQSALVRAARKNGGIGLPLLSVINPEDVSIESLRSLRTGLQFALVEAQNNVVAIISPTAGVGKSFVATNLAQVFASAGVRVVLVDADLRRGHLHRHFGLERQPGLSDAISGAAALDDTLRGTQEPNLSVLPTGSIPANPAELLSSERFETLLKELSGRFDCVIVDTPPILAVTDSALVARLAGVNVLVLRSGRHPIREIASTVKRLVQSGIKLHGAVLNDVSSRGRYRRYDYNYEYSSAPAD
jgi:tyrosine-protein kinase Etk/Wzc